MKLYFHAASINPWNNHPARHFKHKTKECPLLKSWQGQVVEHSGFNKRSCPLCSNKRILERTQKGYRLYLLLEGELLFNTINYYLEVSKTKRQLIKEAESM